MSQLRDAFKSVLAKPAVGPGAPAPGAPAPGAAALVARDPAQVPAPVGPRLADPLSSEWIKLLRVFGGEVPPQATMGQLVQRSDLRSRELLALSRKRDSEELKRAKETFLREREKTAWIMVKARFEALELPEKAYRALKQEGADPEKVLPKLNVRRGEELRGAGAARVRDALLGS